MQYIAKMMSTSADAQFLNRRVYKDFNGTKYHGTVTRMHNGKLNRTLWHIKYDDGDREDVHFEELLKILTIDADVVNQRIAAQQPRLHRNHTPDPEGHSNSHDSEGSKAKTPVRRSTRQRKQAHKTNASTLGDIDANALERGRKGRIRTRASSLTLFQS